MNTTVRQINYYLLVATVLLLVNLFHVNSPGPINDGQGAWIHRAVRYAEVHWGSFVFTQVLLLPFTVRWVRRLQKAEPTAAAEPNADDVDPRIDRMFASLVTTFVLMGSFLAIDRALVGYSHNGLSDNLTFAFMVLLPVVCLWSMDYAARISKASWWIFNQD